MSRDPFIALATAYHFLTSKLLLNDEDDPMLIVLMLTFRTVSIPLHLQYSIGTMLWWREMHFDNGKNLIKKRLAYVKAKGIKYAYQKRYKTDFYQDRP